jgi:AraC-like DNA-binding protein
MEDNLPFEMPGFEPKLHENAFFMAYHSRKISTNIKIRLGYHAFIFVMEGKKTVTYASGSVTADAGHFFFLPSGNCLMSEKIASSGTYRSVLLFISCEALADCLKALPGVNYGPNWSPILFAMDRYIENFVHGLELTEKLHPERRSSHLIKLRELLHYLISIDNPILHDLMAQPHESSDEKRIRQVVSSNVLTSITVKEMAFLCHMSQSTFKRKFEKIYNDSPYRYHVKAKLQKAAELLMQDKSVSEVQHELGYEDLSSFIKSFKRIYNVTPGQYRNLR